MDPRSESRSSGLKPPVASNPAEQAYERDRYRSMTPSQRLEEAIRLSRLATDLAAAGAQKRR